MEDRLFVHEKSELFHLLHAVLRHESIFPEIQLWLFIVAPCCSNSIFGSRTQKCRHLTLSCFGLTLFWKMDLDDDRELRISSGSIIGVIMLLLAMLPRDVRSDLIVRRVYPGNKGSESQHKLWKHVVPRQTEFAWLPRDLPEAFCLPALQLDQNRPYGMLENCVARQALRATITLDQLYFIGDSRSANELEVFINMPIETLRVGCTFR